MIFTLVSNFKNVRRKFLHDHFVNKMFKAMCQLVDLPICKGQMSRPRLA